MAVRLIILGSGSRGNCAVVASSSTRLMVDAGFSRRQTLRRLRDAGQPTDALTAILITHEHSDHVAGLPRLAAHFAAPVYCNELTRVALLEQGSAFDRCEVFGPGHPFMIGDIEVTPFTISHDAADPVGFRFRAEGVVVVVVTDLGYLSMNVKQYLRGADAVVIESNHDLEMLKCGPYSWDLKQRVLSRVGHLSNDSLGDFLRDEFDGRPRELVLAHLSENNNLPELARISAQRALDARPATPSTRLQVASQAEPLPAMYL